ncbi:hypothetical protein BDZ45DRAFT_230598 [Acephala macrosclerotiorum]|nr:hypothetical protein BDZ45DRAFT_230598 [Acephala macrosclerotiorum]
MVRYRRNFFLSLICSDGLMSFTIRSASSSRSVNITSPIPKLDKHASLIVRAYAQGYGSTATRKQPAIIDPLETTARCEKL